MASTSLQRIVPLQEQLRQILRDRIADGRYPPGAEFPSENELAQEFNVSRATVRNAVTALAADGLVIRQRGIGTSVSPLSSITDPLGEALDFFDLITASGFRAGVIARHAEIVEADEKSAKDLAIECGSTLLRVELVLTADGSPVIYCANSIPRWVLGDALLAESAARPEVTARIYEFLEERCGQRTVYHIASLSAELVQSTEIEIPDFDDLTPTLVMRSVAYNLEQRPVFVSLSAYPDKRLHFTLVRKRSA